MLPRSDLWILGCCRGNLELEYKYVVRDPDGGVVCWKPGSNYELRVPVLLEAERAIAEGVRVRDAWDGSIQVCGGLATLRPAAP